MSASAGRVLIIPKGDYDPQTTYTMLDMVYYGGKSYICKQTSTGNLPTNTVYWQIMIDSAGSFANLSDVEFTNLQNGDGVAYNATAHKWENTTPVGITITTPPAKVNYTDGDILDLTGIIVLAEYSTGQTRTITTECTFSPANGATLTTSNTSVTVSWRTFTATQAITVVEPIYGAEWDGTSSTTWTRTDLSANFVDPVPYYSGMTDTPSSPFDNIMPWSGMVTEERTGGTMVKIPKFWYNITKNGNSIKVQICDHAISGFRVSPAHMDRGDGQGERDFVYIGRYHCGENWNSITGVKPRTSNKNYPRGAIHNLGTGYWPTDFAMRFTIWLLYIVEFADWDSQAKIGYGCGNGSAEDYMGYTDSMPYHTGTTQSSRTTYGLGTQYRHIEGLWDNRMDWLDGTYNNSNGFNIILNPTNFSDSAGGISVGVPDTNNSVGAFPSAFDLKDETGTFLMLLPSGHSGSPSTYSCDAWVFNANKAYTNIGGSYNPQDRQYGIFMISATSGASYENVSSRIQELPNNV